MNLSTQDQSFCLSIADREGAQSQIPYNKFFTTGEAVKFPTSKNRFEGRGAYYNYYPTGDIVEQKLEKIWLEGQNQIVVEKRQMEELKRSV